MDNVQKETRVVSVMTLYSLLETVALVRDEKDDRLLPHPMRRQRLMARDKNPQRNQATKRKALHIKGAKFRAVKFFFFKKRHVNFGILPYVRITSLEKDVYMATNAIFDMFEAEGKPSRRSK